MLNAFALAFFLISILVFAKKYKPKSKRRYLFSIALTITLILFVLTFVPKHQNTVILFERNNDNKNNEYKEINLSKFEENEPKESIGTLISLKSPNANKKRLTGNYIKKGKESIKIAKKNLFNEYEKNKKEITGYLYKDDLNTLLPSMSAENRKNLKTKLPWWELAEMTLYDNVWFFGGDKKLEYNEDEDNMNFGFDEWENEEDQDDDDERMLIVIVGDHLEFRYEIIKVLGHGSYGRVVLARDHARPVTDKYQEVAIKILHNESRTVRYFKEEIDITKYIEDNTANPNLYTKILRTFFFRNHYFIVFELLGDSLFRELNGKVQNVSLLSKYIRNILIPVKNLHKIGLVHGDLKPENLMIIPGCNVSTCSPMMKVADFNLACTPSSNLFECPGVYFQTRHYRAPEVILDLNYTVQADMWSVGVIAAEIYLGKLPFYGETSTDQLAAIMEVVGLVPPRMVYSSPRMHIYQKAVNYKCKNGFKRRPWRKPLRKILNGAPRAVVDFIEKCLVIDPVLRMDSDDALRHPLLLS